MQDVDNDIISIIIPVYNTEKYLRKCLTSIIAQTYEYLEIIIVDDGSGDNSSMICDEFANKDKRIKVFHKKTNEGLSAARNFGIEHATGKYIGFVDSDDWIESDMFEYLHNMLIKYDVDISMCSATYVDDEGINIRTGNAPCLDVKQEFVIDTTEDILKHYFLEYGNPKRINVAVWNKLYKRECIENIRFPVGRLYEDVFWLYKVLANANRMIFTECHKYNYRQRKESICNNDFTERYFDILDANVERYNFILDRHYSNLLSDVSNRFVSDGKEMIQLIMKNHKCIMYFNYMIRILYYITKIKFNSFFYCIGTKLLRIELLRL